MFRDSPDGKRIAVHNHGGEGRVAVGVRTDDPTRDLFTWTVAEGLTRNDLMIFADHVRQVAESLPWEADVVPERAGA